MLKNISFIMISTNNKKNLVNFYNNILGLQLTNPHDPISALSFPSGGTKIGFVENDDKLFPNKRIEITIQVDSVRKAITDLQQKGVTFWRGFTKVTEGLHIANFKDPDGNELSILSFGEE